MIVQADVITGTGKGKSLGFPTINADVSQVPLELEEGVYACFVRLGEHGIRVPAAVHYGSRPTLGADRSFEVHVLDQIVAIPPRVVIVDIVAKIRDVQEFASAELLSAQLKRDCKQARDMLCVC